MVSFIAATGAITVFVVLAVIHRIWRLPCDGRVGAAGFEDNGTERKGLKDDPS